jgi:hypothetical protein
MLPGEEGVSTGDGGEVVVEVLLNSKLGNRANVVLFLTEEGSVPLLVVVLLKPGLGSSENVVLLLTEEGSAPLLKRLLGLPGKTMSPVLVDGEGLVPLLMKRSVPLP